MATDRLTHRDSDGTRVGPGDTVRFSYGIPPVTVRAKVVQAGDRLIALTPGHNPESCPLDMLRRHAGWWRKDDEVTP